MWNAFSKMGYNLSVNTKKAAWINKPGKIKTTLHSFSFQADGTHSVFFVLGENDEVTLTCKTEAHSAFVLLHTPDEYISFGESKITLSFSGVRTEIAASHSNTLTLKKAGKHLSFSSGNTEILSVEKDAFRTSASFGFAVTGSGEAYVEVF